MLFIGFYFNIKIMDFFNKDNSTISFSPNKYEGRIDLIQSLRLWHFIEIAG